MSRPVTPTHIDDLERARRLRDGDEAEFEAFFEESFDGLYRFAIGRLDGDEPLAREIVQATLCKVFEKLDTFRGEAALFTWMCSICRSEISAHFRKRGRQPIGFGDSGELPEMLAALDALAAGEASSEDVVIDRERTHLVHQTLDRMPRHYGDALEWKYFDGISVVEIAERLGVGPKAAESLLTRAREAFRRAFTALATEAAHGVARIPFAQGSGP